MSKFGSVEFKDENGLAYGVKQVSNKPRVSCMPYLYDIAEGNIAGHTRFGAFGERENVAVIANGSDMWNGVATTQPYPVSTGEQLSIVSTSAQDGVGGTGVLTVTIHYLDDSGTSQTTEVTMNGTTAVNLTPALVKFVQFIHTETVGTNGASVGKITIYKTGTASSVYKFIAIGSNSSEDAMRMVPSGKTAYLTTCYATAAEKSVSTHLRVTAHNNEYIENVFIPHFSAFLKDSTINQEFNVPIMCPSLSIIKMSVFVPATKAGADVSGGFFGWVE